MGDDMATIIGTDGDDNFENSLFGTSEDDEVFGLLGQDFLFASLGSDLLDGGGDEDVAIYDNLSSGVFINASGFEITDTWMGVETTVAANTVDKGFGSDTLTSIENFNATNFDDVVYLSDPDFNGTYVFDRGGDDVLYGDRNGGGYALFFAGSGNDTYFGSIGNVDRIDYRTGAGDTVDAPQFQGATVTFTGLRSGTATDPWGNTDTFSEIEAIDGSDLNDVINGGPGNNFFTGGDGDDEINGNGGFDDIDGGAGDDTLRGGSEGDTIDGDEGNDYLEGDNFGEFGNDNLNGGIGDDIFAPGFGDDNIDGGEGLDVIFYNSWGLTSGVTINNTDTERDGVAAFTTDKRGFGTDTLTNVEAFHGSEWNDTIYVGGLGGGYTFDRAGDDTVIASQDPNATESHFFAAGSGSDTYVGTVNRDAVDYTDDGFDSSFIVQGVVVDLATGTATDGWGGTDTLTSIEDVNGTRFGDTIQGDDEDNRLIGLDGDDTIEGRGGDDNIDGNAGADDISGGDGNDDLSGGAGDDIIDGGVGGDFLQPGAGNDTVIGGDNGPLGEDDDLSYIFDSIDSETTNGINATFTGEFEGTVTDYAGGLDTFSGIERIRGTNNNDTFNGAEGRQIFRGFGGDDDFDGGAGDSDLVDYRRDAADLGSLEIGIDVSLAAGFGTDTYGDTDTYTNIEQIRGSNFDDTIVGDSNSNRLRGADGDDTIDSFGGANNSISGERGNDIIFARGDDDFAEGGEGNDEITFFGVGGSANPGLGSDTISGGTEGFFSIEYFGVGESLTIDTALGTTELAGGDVDTFTNIRNVGGGDGDDTLLGDDADERQEFFTSLGDDFIDGRGGDRDWLIYDARDETSITVDFSTGTATGDFAGTDTFVNIEAVRGTSGDDTFIGGDQEITIYQGLDGVDSYAGGSGQDRLSFTFDDNRGGLDGVIVDLAAGTATDGFGNDETFTSIEQVISTDQDDTLDGNAEANVLIGLDGSDNIDGREGNDEIFAGFGIDTITGGTGSDLIGGRIAELDGDTITDFEFEDRIAVYDDDFNLIGANTAIVGNELRIDIDGDGAADATMTLSNGYSGPVNSEGGPVGGPQPAVISVDSAGSFGLAITEGDAGISEGTITLRRSGDIFSTATVDVTLAGSGLDPADAPDVITPLGIPQTVTFLPGQREATFTVQVAGDTAIEGDEALSLTLSNPSSDGVVPAELAGSQTFVRILNDDEAATVSISGENAQEDSGVLTFTVSRTGDTSAEIIVPYTIRSAEGLLGSEADDLVGGLPQSGTVTIPAGASSATFDVEIAADDIAELHDNVIAAIQTDASWPADLNIGVREAIGSIRNDDGVPGEIPIGAGASSYGDPHIVTLDGLGYDFQAVGEFTLIEATSGADLLVQVRYQPVPGSDIASQTEAIATRLGGVSVMIEAGSPASVTIGGVPVDPNDAVGGLSVGDGEVYFDGEAITVVYATGEQLRVDLFDGFLNASVFLEEGREVRGLLGDGDGDSSNDLALPDGTLLPQPISFDDLYGVYADAWRISNTTSLFTYAPGEGTENFTDLSFPVGELSMDAIPDELRTIIEEAVAAIDDPVLREAAIFDAIATGDIETAIASAQTAASPTTMADVSDAPEITSALGVLASETEIVEGQDGVQSLVFTVYRTGDLSEEVEISYSFGGSADAEDLTGATPGQLTLAAGQVAGIVEIGVLGDSNFEANEDVTFNFELLSGDAAIINGSTTVDILDDDVVSPAVETVETRYEINEGCWRDKLTYSVDGEQQSSQRLRLIQDDIKVKGGGLTISADDGEKWGFDFITTAGAGLGVYSLFGDRFWRPEARRVDDNELLRFSLDDSGGFGDAIDIEFEFASVRRGDQVKLQFFDDGELVDTTIATIVDGELSYELADGESFDVVTIAAEDDVEFSLEAFEFSRLHADEFDFAIV